MLYYHTLIKPAVVCFCVAVHPSVNMHLLETKELYFMKTELSDLYADNFSEEVHFYLRKYHSCCLLGFFLPLQSSPHSLAEVRFPQCLVVQLQTLQHSNVPQKNDQKNPQDLHCLFCSLQPRSCIENMLISKMWTLISRLTVLMNISQNPILETENFCKNFSIVWLWPCKAEPTPWLWSSIGSRSAGEGEACKGTGAGE